MNISQAPQGINVVVELERTVFIGRLGSVDGEKVLIHDAAVHEVGQGEDPENFIRMTAKYGVPVEHRDLVFEAHGIRRVRKLGDVPKA